MDRVKNKLAQIEKQIEEENSRAVLNRMPARFFMFFLLIGGDEDSRFILERKVKELLCNPEACEFLQITQPGETLSGEAVEQALRTAAQHHVDVQNLNHVLLCPVVFANSGLGANIVSALTEIDAYMNRSGHTPTWQPAIIINKNVSEYANIYSCVSEMTRFISSMPEGNVNRCCWLSDLDENGFAVPRENIMQTIAMVTVLQNVVTQTENGAQAIRAKVSHSSTSEDGQRLFFTARNAAVTNPRRSLILQRLAVAMDFFAGQGKNSDAMARLNYSFVREIMGQYLAALPQHGGRITLFPLYGVMCDRMLHSRLERVINEQYVAPLCGEEVRKKQLEKAKQAFLANYFAANGSLSELRQLLSQNALEQEFSNHQGDCYTNVALEVPFTDGKKLGMFLGGEYGEAAKYCEGLISRCGWDLLRAVGEELSQPGMIAVITAIEEEIEKIHQCIQIRMRQLKDVETVLVVDQTELRTNFHDTQSAWLEQAAKSNPQSYEELNRRFDKKIYELLQSDEVDCSELLDICYAAVKNTAPTNVQYMDRVGEECMTNSSREREFVGAVEKNWCYTLRFLQRDETRDTTCVIGDASNYFCRSLQDKFGGPLFEFSGFDRVDILHISGAFSPENILEWEQIKASGEGAGEV